MKPFLKYLTMAIATVCLPYMALSQNNLSSLVFEEYEWDFGNINEADGTVTHTFTFTNTDNCPVILERVKPDCGCTATNYSKAPVPPRAKGQIEITFDPSQMSGHFNKKITVLSNGGKNRNLLTIKGHVTRKPGNIEDEYPFAILDGVRANALHAALSYVENGSAKSAVIEIINTSSVPVSIEAVSSDTHDGIFKFAVPARLAAGEKGIITLTCDLSGSNLNYGMLTRKLYLKVNGTTSELPLTLNGIAVDHFSPKDTAVAAHCEITPVYRHFGDVKPGTVLECSVEIKNTGRSKLIIRDVAARKNTEYSLATGTEIAPGESISVMVRVRTGNNSFGLVTGGISLVVNDPARPYREIRFAADVH